MATPATTIPTKIRRSMAQRATLKLFLLTLDFELVFVISVEDESMSSSGYSSCLNPGSFHGIPELGYPLFGMADPGGRTGPYKGWVYPTLGRCTYLEGENKTVY